MFTHADLGHLKLKLFFSPLLQASSLPVCVTFAHLIMFLFSWTWSFHWCLFSQSSML